MRGHVVTLPSLPGTIPIQNLPGTGAYPQLYFHVDRLFVKGDPLERVDRDADN